MLRSISATNLTSLLLPSNFFLRHADQFFRVLLFQHPVSTLRNALHRQRPQRNPFHFFQRMPLAKKYVAQRLHLRVAHLHFIPKIPAAPASIRTPPAASPRVSQLFHSPPRLFAQSFQIGERQHPFHFHIKSLLNRIPLFQKRRRKVAVIRHEHKARARILQISHGIHSRGKSSQQIFQRFSSLGIGQRGHHFRRLVHQQIDTPFFGFHRAARYFDAIFFGIRLRPKLRHHASIHAHLSAQDQLLRVAPRSNSRSRNNFLQSLLQWNPLVNDGTDCHSERSEESAFALK